MYGGGVGMRPLLPQGHCLCVIALEGKFIKKFELSCIDQDFSGYKWMSSGTAASSCSSDNPRHLSLLACCWFHS